MQERYLHHITAIDVSDIRYMMEHYGEDIWRYAYFLTKDAHLADDVAQETFIKAYRRFHTFRGQSSVKTWLLKIARNTALTYKNKAFFRKVTLFDSRTSHYASSLESHSAPSAEKEVIDEETGDELWKAVLDLPGKYRDPLLLRFHYQLSLEEISDILGVSVGTVKSRLHRAKQKAAHLLKGGDFHA